MARMLTAELDSKYASAMKALDGAERRKDNSAADRAADAVLAICKIDARAPHPADTFVIAYKRESLRHVRLKIEALEAKGIEELGIGAAATADRMRYLESEALSLVRSIRSDEAAANVLDEGAIG